MADNAVSVTSSSMGDEVKLTPEQEALVEAGPGGGVVAYIHRLLDDHWFTFPKGRNGPILGGCTCGDVSCARPYLRLHRDRLIQAHALQTERLAEETRRTGRLVEELLAARAHFERLLAGEASESPKQWVSWIDGALKVTGFENMTTSLPKEAP